MRLIPEIVECNKERCEYLFKSLEVLCDKNRYKEPTKDVPRVGAIYSRLLYWVFNSDNPIDTEDTLHQEIEKVLGKLENAHLRWVVERMILVPDN